MAKKIRLSDLIVPALLLAIAAASLYIRIVLPYGGVFTPDIIKLTGADAYFYMRLVDNIVYNFPRLTPFDPYYLYPGGAATGEAPDLFAYFIAFFAWLFSGCHFSQQGIDTVAVFIPPVIGTLVIVPLYFIGKEILNRWTGVLAAAIYVILPVEIGRSLLGYTDQHIAEVLITTTLVMCLVLALKSGDGLELEKPVNRQWKVLGRPLIYSICAGLCLGLYFLTWIGALFFILLLFIYFLVQFTIDHIRGKPVDGLCLAGFVSGAVALIAVLAGRPTILNIISLLVFTLFPVIMMAVSRYFHARAWRARYYPMAIILAGLLSLAALFLVSPSFIKAMFENVGFIFIPQLSNTNVELQPLLFTLGRFTLDGSWESFTTSFFLSLIGLGIVIYRAVKSGDRNMVLLVVWSVIILAATLSMRRFAYYYTVNAALLTGYLSWLVLSLAGFGKAGEAKPVQPVQAVTRKAKKRQHFAERKHKRPVPALAYKALGVIGICFVVFYPNFGPLPDGARPIYQITRPTLAPSDAWCDALTWLRKNTPEPMDDANAYYKLWEKPLAGAEFKYPDSAYGVLAWWDRGYWISRIGRRIPMLNPGMGAQSEFKYASFFMSEDEKQAGKILESGGGKYVIIDFDTALPLKFYGIALSSGTTKEKYYDVYYQKQGGALSPIILFYPEYYRTVMVRLYNFDGKAMVENNAVAISFQNTIDASGQPYKKVIDYRSFKSYSEAQSYVAQQKTGQYKIGGTDPFVSPVALPALADFKLCHNSAMIKLAPSGGAVPEVKVFEYAK